jgi:tetratricopeptide (TPR) repeat protein
MTESDREQSLEELSARRVQLERELQEQGRELTPEEWKNFRDEYEQLRRLLLQNLARASSDAEKIEAVAEILRAMENELIHLHNFLVAPSEQDIALARKLDGFLRELKGAGVEELSPLETLYFLGILAMYEGEPDNARSLFESACESEESDEANDIKYKSFVMLGHLSHVERDYERAQELHEKSMQYTRNSNVTAQALALKALNSYALGNSDDALELFESSLELFREGEPFYNEYFHRNALLFCGAILFEREQYARSAEFYEKVLDHVESSSYDYFDALAQLGKIHFAKGDYAASAETFRKAIEKQSNENEYLLDTLYWLARAHLKIEQRVEAKRCLEQVVSSPVAYQKKPQAQELLRNVS